VNIKYKELSIIGKIWSLAELFAVGIRDNNKKYVDVAISKLKSLIYDDIVSNAASIDDIKNLSHNAKIQKQYIFGGSLTGAYNEDGSIIEAIWFDCLDIHSIKQRVKNDSLMKTDLNKLNDIYYEIYNLWINDLKNKELSSKERRDLFKIKEEIKSYKEKIEKRVEHNQITII